MTTDENNMKEKQPFNKDAKDLDDTRIDWSDQRADSRKIKDHRHFSGDDSETKRPAKEDIERKEVQDWQKKIPGEIDKQIHEPSQETNPFPEQAIETGIDHTKAGIDNIHKRGNKMEDNPGDDQFKTSTQQS